MYSRRVVTCTTGEADGWIYLKLELLHYPFSLDLATLFFLYFYHRSSRTFFFFFFFRNLSLIIDSSSPVTVDRANSLFAIVPLATLCVKWVFAAHFTPLNTIGWSERTYENSMRAEQKGAEVLALEFL